MELFKCLFLVYENVLIVLSALHKQSIITSNQQQEKPTIKTVGLRVFAQLFAFTEIFDISLVTTVDQKSHFRKISHLLGIFNNEPRNPRIGMSFS